MAALFVLHRQPLREQEWLLDVFSEQHGRLHLVAGERTRPDLLTRYSGHWADGEDWPRLRLLESMESLQPDSAVSLYCGLYLNELLSRLLPRNEPLAAVFQAYADTLKGLQTGGLPDPWLRLFEVQLLTALGYGFSWQEDTDGRPLQADACYQFRAGAGFSLSEQGYRGAHLSGFVCGGEHQAQGYNVAKRVLRSAIDGLLDKPLVSRELFQGLPDPR